MNRRLTAAAMLVATLIAPTAFAEPGDTIAVSYSSVLNAMVKGFDHSVSGDGRYVVFSTADPVTRLDVPSLSEVYLFDRETNTRSLLTVENGVPSRDFCYNAQISANARYVLITCLSAGLVLLDRVEKTRITVDSAFSYERLSSSGRYVAFTRSDDGVYVWDRITGMTERVRAGERLSSPSISDDGRLVVFTSYEAGQSDVFVLDRATGDRALVSSGLHGGRGNDDSYAPRISADGRVVAFASSASDLVPGDAFNNRQDLFVRDLSTQVTERINVSTGGAAANDITEADVSLSGDGRFVAFASRASNLDVGDTNGKLDVFVRDRALRATKRVSVRSNGTEVGERSNVPVISRDGSFVAFRSTASFTGVPRYSYPAVYGHEMEALVPLPIILSPGTLEFGQVEVGTVRAAKAITLTNTSANAVSISNVSIHGADADQFAESSDGCTGKTLAIGAECVVGYRFFPTVLGRATARVVVNLGPNIPKGYGYLRGTGVQ